MIHAETVRAHYGRIATGSSRCDGCGCGERTQQTFSLGTGDVVGAADLRPGETVLDLGSGTGHDALRAADLVGPTGRVEGVDLTTEMVERARSAAGERGNVSFRLGDIAALPFADGSFDAVLTNCVVNLAPDKRRVLAEARRVLRPGGRLVLSDVVFAADPGAAVRADDALGCACVGGAAVFADYLRWLREVGLGGVRIVDGRPYGVYGGAEALAVTLVARERADAQTACC